MNSFEKINNIDLLKAFTTSTTDGLQIADAQGKLVFLNDVAKNRLGLDTSKQVYIWDFEPFFKDLNEWKKHVNDLKKTGSLVIRSTNINVLTGKKTPVEATVTKQKIKGEDYVFAVTRDISDLLEKERRLNLRETMLLAISQATSELLYNNDFFKAVVNVLGIIGKAVKVDRTYLFTCGFNNDGVEVASQRSEWNSGDAEPQIDNPDLQDVPLSLFDDFVALMRNNKPFQSIVENLDKESALKEILQSQGIISILIIPIFHKGKFWGFVGYDECKYERIWEDVEVSILQTLSNNMSTALDRLDYNIQIKNLAEFPLENPAPVIRINESGEVLFQNKLNQIKNSSFRIEGKEAYCDLSELLGFIAGSFSSMDALSYVEVRSNENKYYTITAKKIENKSYINLYFSDITKLKKTEKQLKATRSIVNQIVNNMEDVIWSVTYPEYKALFISPSTEKICGLNAKEFYRDSQLWQRPIVDEDKYIIGEIFNNLEKYGESDTEYRIKLPDGSIKWLRNKTKLVLDLETGKPFRLDGYIIDITDQKLNQVLSEKARDLAEESSRAKEEFISNMSHEIRTPLNAILGFSNKLNHEIDDKELTETVQMILFSARHLQSLIENILDFSKIKAGQFDIQNVNTNVFNELHGIYNLLITMIGHKKIALDKFIDEDLNRFISLDKRRLNQIVINILTNAIKYTDEGIISIKASVAKEQDLLKIQINDTGVGMSKDFLNKIFDKFSREESLNLKTTDGLGLGMAITKILLNLMGGTILIESEEGKGTNVKLEIPFSAAEYDRVNSTKSLNFDLLAGKDILVVEDNQMNAIVVSSFLKRHQVNITIVENGKDAIEILEKQSFDAILMDVQMPIIDGIEGTKIIRGELNLTIPIIGLSANALSSSKNECINAGMDDYITKPFDEERLIESLTLSLNNNFSDNQKPYDLSNFKATHDSDNDLLKKLIEIFIETTPKEVLSMKKALKNEDYDSVKKIAHKIKPNFFILGISQGNINYINTIEISSLDKKLLQKHITSLEKTVEEAVEVLTEDFL